MIREDELHMLACAIYDELRGESGIASVQHVSIHDDAANCVMNNSEKVPNFLKKFSIFLLKSIKLRHLIRTPGFAGKGLCALSGTLWTVTTS